MTRRLSIGAALAAALLLTWCAWEGWLYLQRGYSLGVGMPGERASIFQIDFPAWRAAAHVLLWVAAMIAIFVYVAGLRWASSAAWLAFGATVAVGIYDVAQYGTMGSPTSAWVVLLLLLFALLTRFGSLEPPMEA